MKSESGDLIELALNGRFDVIVHGCNCFCAMNVGIARSIQEEFPEAFAADLVTTKGDRTKLGNFSSATVTRGPCRITIVNGYTQFNYHGEPPLVDYQAVRQLFHKIKMKFGGKRIGYPRLGAGLGGGDWEMLAAIIDEELPGEDHTLVIRNP